jgi:hypothetical protein
MSITGSAIRLWRLLGERGQAKWSRALWGTGAVLVIVVVWAIIVAWYLVFGVLLVPYRVIRRHARKRKVEALRHAELLSRLDSTSH